MTRQTSRRDFLRGAAATTGALVVAGCAGTRSGAMDGTEPADEEHEEGVSPAEDLMREHGVLNRVLLVYEEGIRRIDGGEPVDLQVVGRGATLIRSFVEDYHEKLEEDHLFPRFERAGKLVDLVRVLREQHEAGRRVTDSIVRLAGSAEADARRDLAASLRAFVRMYRPHEAREDTVLFPAFRELVSAREWELLGEQFEEQEHAKFGEHGFDEVVGRVAEMERAFGIDDLAKFTAR